MTVTGPSTNRYLNGAYAPVTEEVTAFDLPVTGTIPVELDGRYLRNGPNPFGPVDPDGYHWFTGDGMVHGVRLRDGRAEWYRNRWVRSTKVSEGLGEEPAPGERFGGFDGANTNVIGHAGRYYAIVEAGARPVEIDGELNTVCHSDLDGTLPHGYTAHPKRDPEYRRAARDVVLVGSAERHRVHRRRHRRPGASMRSTSRCRAARWSTTCRSPTDHVVAYDLPVTFNLDAAAAGTTFPYQWDEDYGARVGVLAREAPVDAIRWFDVDPCYVFHPLNAYDEGDRVVLDVVRHPKMFATDLRGPNDGAPTLWRWIVDLTAGQVKEEQLDDLAVEFPRVDERVVGRRHRWALANQVPRGDEGDRADTEFEAGGIVRYDLDTGAREVRDVGRGRGAGEAVFIPRSDGAAEDDGWVMAFVTDAAEASTELVILDAGDISGDPVATVQLPQRVPLGFHGNWIPST